MPLVGFQLCLARTSRADAAAESAHRLVPDRQSRQIILILRQLDLELALSGFGALGKNVENQCAPVQYRRAGYALQRLDL